ncbi:MAG: bacterioferritin [Zoogloea sp.]|nr:bacterioferritin [Zoogloea sp.]
MYVCVCRAVTERQIEQAVKDGARRMRDLREDLGVTEECGRCAVCAKQCLESALAKTPEHSHASALQPRAERYIPLVAEAA